MRTSVAEKEEEEGIISFHVIGNSLTNECSEKQMMWLLQLQGLFGTQLPKMPKEYITRIVFDRTHKSLVVNKTSE